jgi:acyl carrier protein
VKIRGFRVEPGEIEAKLTACAGVREAAVIVREDQPGDKRLIAYLTGDAIDAAALRAALAADLPDYMVPTAFVQLDAFPVSPNGKLDRKALPAPNHAALPVRSYEAPQGDTETALAALWQDLLRVERVGRTDHFFELGGHSLLAVQLTVRLREHFLVDIPLKTVFEQPVLHALVDAVIDALLAGFSADDIAAAQSQLNEEHAS